MFFPSMFKQQLATDLNRHLYFALEDTLWMTFTGCGPNANWLQTVFVTPGKKMATDRIQGSDALSTAEVLWLVYGYLLNNDRVL